MDNLSLYILLAPVILFALTFHEFSHAWMAYRLGDSTARDYGRLTMNPLAHLDFFGTLMLIFSGFRFGWAKPVPVNVYNLKNPKAGMLWVALAGPASNVLTALACGLILRSVTAPQLIEGNSGTSIFLQMTVQALFINLSLAFFNLIPVPPLDGSKILYGLLPDRYTWLIAHIEAVGPMVLIGLILFGSITGVNILGMIFFPFVRLFAFLFSGLQI